MGAAPLGAVTVARDGVDPADGEVKGIPASGQAGGWDKAQLDGMAAEWAPRGMCDGVGGAWTVGPTLRDGSGHDLRLTPGAADTVTVQWLAVGVSSARPATAANL